MLPAEATPACPPTLTSPPPPTDPAATAPPHPALVAAVASTYATQDSPPGDVSPAIPAHLLREARPTLPSRVGDYDVLGELGRGGMGVVYKAVQRDLKRTVALKMILSGEHAGRDQLARFRAEAEAVARLRHPNIIQIYEIDEDDQGRPFFSLEFADGGSLDGRTAGTPQSPDSAARLVAVLARAMHAAHQAGVVHRDLKPANILLASGGGEPPVEVTGGLRPPLASYTPKITDFGLAKRLDEVGHTRDGAVMGTPSYMAPEQAGGLTADVGPRADVYALAAILYELLTGRPPFKGATALDTIDLVRTQEPVPPTRLQPKLPPDVETVCLKGLHKDPARRYASAADLADDLQRWLDGRPILARPAGAWERTVKWARRRPALAALAGVGAVAVVAVVIGAVLLALYMSQQADAARQQAGRTRTVEHLGSQGQEDEVGGRLDAAENAYSNARAILNVDPGAASPEMRGRLEAGLERVRRRLADRAGEQGLQA
ncbi:MAG TPA: serine/threonine-protein kinase, partial [Gemmataceae bacterium]|nr:serine/threonine-protein kinase [Gemmataceae bacterium]